MEAYTEFDRAKQTGSGALRYTAHPHTHTIYRIYSDNDLFDV